MEEHFLKNLVSGPSGVALEPWYNPDGDCIIYQMSDEAIVADRVDEVLTIYRSVNTGNAIGYQIKGVAAIIQRFGLDGLAVISKEDNKELLQVSAYALLLAAYERGPKTIGRRKSYVDVFEACPSPSRVQIEQLAPA